MNSLARRIARKEFAGQVMRLKHEERISALIDEQGERVLAIFEAAAERVANGTAVERSMPGDRELAGRAQSLLETWAYGNTVRIRRLRTLFDRAGVTQR